MPNPVAAITINHLNELLDGEIEAVKRMEVNERSRGAILLYIESLQRRINRTAFDQMARLADEQKDGDNG